MSRLGTDVADVADLISFKAELIRLSDELDNIYNFLKSDLTELSYNWQDRKFFEFDQSFAPKKEEIRKISESYRTWANTSLQSTIDILIDMGATKLG